MHTTHILRPGIDLTAPIVVAVMECGACCVILDDLTCVPRTDFYMPKWGRKANCEPCKRAKAEREEETRKATAGA